MNQASAFSHIADYYAHLYSIAKGLDRRQDCMLRLRLITMVFQMRQDASP